MLRRWDGGSRDREAGRGEAGVRSPLGQVAIGAGVCGFLPLAELERRSVKNAVGVRTFPGHRRQEMVYCTRLNTTLDPPLEVR